MRYFVTGVNPVVGLSRGNSLCLPICTLRALKDAYVPGMVSIGCGAWCASVTVRRSRQLRMG
ncbi:hypothetical protein BT63DRAFT_426661 [Microthyrium microscopicum]|uniref:Uncharacterized protein n=1 Tax=Microthyrium microscopicum TaxID=703497 RepID=A0A6A6U935_9PEZI|nr:hypothetical protein BT63DRAFT_426661 [Microthyrium microscopicum]